MKRLLWKPTPQNEPESEGRFEKFNLTENPFPSEPSVNKDSTDKRINGDIYDVEIRRKEYDQIEANFLRQRQSDPNHLRLGYIIDTSYIGRGNGKSAFLVNLLQTINKGFCQDISNGVNKCFAAYVAPEPGGRTKTFGSFVDAMFAAITRSDIVKISLAMLRLEAIMGLYPNVDFGVDWQDESTAISSLNSREWFEKHSIDLAKISGRILESKYLQDLPSHFPLFRGRGGLFSPPFVSQSDFEQYYVDDLKRGKDRLDFVFSHLIRFFQAAGFNGAYILVDDFERIPDFQSARQKKDFALELRSCLFDGSYLNARLGFYTFLLVLHAGVPRLISDAWAESGMENRAPISPQTTSKHIIPFQKLSPDHAVRLIEKYLSEYRSPGKECDTLFPFTKEAVGMIGELSEYNAAKILRTAYDLLDRAADIPYQMNIDGKFINDNRGVLEAVSDRGALTIENAESIDLLRKAQNRD